MRSNIANALTLNDENDTLIASAEVEYLYQEIEIEEVVPVDFEEVYTAPSFKVLGVKRG
jgi:hypothetical protein